jgi:hypothetical protein
MHNKRNLNILTIIVTFIIVLGIGIAVTQKGSSSSSKDVTTPSILSSSSSSSSASSSAKSSSVLKTVKNPTTASDIQNNIKIAVSKNKAAATLDSVTFKDGVLSVVFKDSTSKKQADLSAYLGTYATSVITVVQTASTIPAVTSVQVARKVNLSNGSQFAAASLWSGDELKNAKTNLKNGNTFAQTMTSATRYAIGGSVWATFDQRAKNEFKNHVSGGKSGDTVQSFSDWVDAGTVQN